MRGDGDVKVVGLSAAPVSATCIGGGRRSSTRGAGWRERLQNLFLGGDVYVGSWRVQCEREIIQDNLLKLEARTSIRNPLFGIFAFHTVYCNPCLRIVPPAKSFRCPILARTQAAINGIYSIPASVCRSIKDMPTLQTFRTPKRPHGTQI